MDELLIHYLKHKELQNNIFEGLKMYANRLRYNKEIAIKEGANMYDGVLIKFYTDKHKACLEQLKEMEREINTMSFEKYKATNTAASDEHF